MDYNKMINECLLELKDKDPYSIKFSQWVSEKYGLDSSENTKACQHIFDSKLFDDNSYGLMITISLSKFGREVIRNHGDWCKYLESLKPKKWYKNPETIISLFGNVLFAGLTTYFAWQSNELSNDANKFEIQKENYKSELDSTKQLLKEQIELNRLFIDSIHSITNIKDSLQNFPKK